MTVYTLRHCCHNCYNFECEFDGIDEKTYCREGCIPSEAPCAANPIDCSKFAINTNNANFIFDEETILSKIKHCCRNCAYFKVNTDAFEEDTWTTCDKDQKDIYTCDFTWDKNNCPDFEINETLIENAFEMED